MLCGGEGLLFIISALTGLLFWRISTSRPLIRQTPNEFLFLQASEWKWLCWCPWIVCVLAPPSPGVDHFNLAGIDFSRHMRSRKYILGRCFIPPQWFYKSCVGYCLTNRSTNKNAEEQYFYRDNIENTYISYWKVCLFVCNCKADMFLYSLVEASKGARICNHANIHWFEDTITTCGQFTTKCNRLAGYLERTLNRHNGTIWAAIMSAHSLYRHISLRSINRSEKPCLHY